MGDADLAKVTMRELRRLNRAASAAEAEYARSVAASRAAYAVQTAAEAARQEAYDAIRAANRRLAMECGWKEAG